MDVIYPLSPSISIMSVNIPSFSTEADAEGKFTKFLVRVVTGACTWEIRKRYTHFRELHTTISSDHQVSATVIKKLPTLPKKKIVGSSLQQEFVEERRLALEQYLQQLVSIPEVFKLSAFVDFIEDKTVAHHHLFDMQVEMSRMKELTTSLSIQLQKSQSELKHATSQIEALIRRISILEEGTNGSLSNSGRNSQSSSSLLHTTGESTNLDDSGSSQVGVAPSLSVPPTRLQNAWMNAQADILSPMPVLHTVPFGMGGIDGEPGQKLGSRGSTAAQQQAVKRPSVGSIGDSLLVDRYSNMTPNSSATPDLDFSQHSGYHGGNGSALPMPANAGYFVLQMLSMGNRGYNRGSESSEQRMSFESPGVASDDGYMVGGSTDTSWSRVVGSGGSNDDAATLLPQRRHSNRFSTLIRPDQVPRNADPSLWDVLVDEVLAMVQPQEAQVNYRRKVSSYIGKQCQKLISCKCFDIGLQGLRCFLPDDPIHLSIFATKGHDASWHVRLNERLCRLSGGMTTADDVDSMDFVANEQAHMLSNVLFFTGRTEEEGHRLLCLVDGLVGVEVHMNARIELCLVAFWEAFSRAVGKNNLFKRSLLLIRAWWVYEARMDAFTSGIPDVAFAVMVAAVINRHHESLFSPFQVLCQFLAEYSTLDVSSSVITLTGPVSVDAYINLPDNISTQGNSMSTDLLKRYQNLALAKDVEVNSVTSLMNESEYSADESPVFVTPSEMAKVFGGRCLMVAHPLLGCKNMIPDSASQHDSIKRGQMFTDAVRAGAMAVLPLLEGSGALGGSNAHVVIEQLFKTTTQRFGRGSRPDSPTTILPIGRMDSTGGGSLSIDRDSRVSLSSPLVSVEGAAGGLDLGLVSDPMLLSLDKLWERIMYCNLVLENRVSESALHTLSCQVLREKGPLPVGEVGKMLQEACPSIPNMSMILKERFNGLKKFLERYLEDFVLGVDHPFNPTVYLRSLLTVEDVNIIKRGDVLQASVLSKLGKKSSLKQMARGSLGRTKKAFSSNQLGQYTQGMQMPAPMSHMQSMQQMQSGAMSSHPNMHMGIAGGGYTPQNVRQQRNSYSGEHIPRSSPSPSPGGGAPMGGLAFRNSISGPPSDMYGAMARGGGGVFSSNAGFSSNPLVHNLLGGGDCLPASASGLDPSASTFSGMLDRSTNAWGSRQMSSDQQQQQYRHMGEHSVKSFVPRYPPSMDPSGRGDSGSSSGGMSGWDSPHIVTQQQQQHNMSYGSYNI